MANKKTSDYTAVPSGIINPAWLYDIAQTSSANYKATQTEVSQNVIDETVTGLTTTATTTKTAINELVSTKAENGANSDITSMDVLEYIDFALTAATIQERRFFWDADAGTLTIGMPGGLVALQIGQEQHLSDRPRNNQGVQIDNGEVVYLSGAAGAIPEVKLANASIGVSAIRTIAVATQNIPNNQRGYYTTFGIVRDLDTSTYSEGDLLWLDISDGGLTNDQPPAPACPVRIGIVTRSHATEGAIFVTIEVDRLLLQQEVTKEPTGFTDPENVIVTYDSSARTVTLTGTVVGYYRGTHIESLVSSWVSTPHSVTNGQYFLVYNGTSFSWVAPSAIDFSYLLIAYANYETSYKFGLRECHGLMPWQSHKELHKVIGTYRDSGGDIGDYTLLSTTTADRRPSVSITNVEDEDLPTANPLLSAGGNYSNFTLSATETANFNLSATEIVPLSGSNPYYNEFTGGAWQQTLMTNNYYMSVWLVAVPVAIDAGSQSYRYLWVQGQAQSALLSTEQGRSPIEVSLGELATQTPEFVFISQFILRYIGANWYIQEINRLEGTKIFQSSAASGSYLSVVTHDDTLIGDGTTSNPLSVVGSTQDPVISFLDFTTSEPATPTVGDRYIDTVTGTGSQTPQTFTVNYIYEWNGTDYTETIPTEGFLVWVESVNLYIVFNGTAWVSLLSEMEHESITIPGDGETSFILNNTPDAPEKSFLFLGGVQYPYGAGKAFTISGTTLTWNDYLGVTTKTTDDFEIWYNVPSGSSGTGILLHSNGFWVDYIHGIDTNSGKNENDPFKTDSAARAAILASTPSPTNRFAIKHIGAVNKNIGTFDLPDYASIIWEGGEITGTIIAGAESTIIYDRLLAPNGASAIVGDGKTFFSKGNYLGPASTNSVGISLENGGNCKSYCNNYNFIATDCQVYAIETSAVLFLAGNTYREYQASTKVTGAATFIDITDFGSNADSVTFNEIGDIVLNTEGKNIILKDNIAGEIFRNNGKHHKFTNIPLFSAHLSADAIDSTGNGTAWDFIANVVDFDIGSNYSNLTGLFTAPVAGKYQPFCNVQMRDLAAAFTSLQIKFVSTLASFNVYECNPGAIITPSNVLTISATVPPIELNSGNTYKFQVVISGATKTVDIGQIVSRIGCYLITAD